MSRKKLIIIITVVLSLIITVSAIVTVSQSGSVTIDGTESEWIYGVEPPDKHPDEEPRVSSGKWELLKK